MMNPVIKEKLHQGTVIPAHPLALTSEKNLDEAGQRALTRYYMEAGAGGVAVGVHTTQFEIRDPEINLFEQVLRLAMEEIKAAGKESSFIKIAGVCGPVQQAVKEATLAKDLGYDLGLLSMGGLDDLTEDELINRTEKVAEILPVFGFYLQPSVGGRVLSYEFWQRFAEILNVHAIKIAPFNRYLTLDVVRAVASSQRNQEIALYTGNDDNIINDLLTIFKIQTASGVVEKKFAGGLLGHWSVWTRRAVEQFKEVKKAQDQKSIPSDLLTIGQDVTDANAAFFDANNQFQGCIAGINEVLTRQGILQGNWCLYDKERLSPAQSAEIDRVYEQYPHLNDDEFVRANLDKWLKTTKKV
ncbi:dihydrodipicolinate synthase family protein [Thalassobacillus sp. CUG 92003]|uniref:dihydrodipicolinate synthase family protein n=1 Tax=Thalassobacillus sp. CUG 92003 TaxID=2736641 RepID=UPI0015E631DE|nr:dihydrodipicolinate synthase family protein [Thalassobacillus sp. CUG 92003]